MPLRLPEPGRAALLLDVDGTLLDFAPTPDAVVVPPDLLVALQRLQAALGGALGVVSGRPVEQVDALLGDAPHAVAGEHGGAWRREPGGALQRPDLPALPPGWLERAEAMIARHAGARLERKERGFVLHYRQAPAAGQALQNAVAALVAPDERFQVLRAAMAWEVRPAGIDKGGAVERLMAAPPFAGRLPIYIGDDVTDEDAIRVARAMGGAGLLVADTFGTPERVRAWLGESAALGGAGWAPA